MVHQVSPQPATAPEPSDASTQDADVAAAVWQLFGHRSAETLDLHLRQTRLRFTGVSTITVVFFFLVISTSQGRL